MRDEMIVGTCILAFFVAFVTGVFFVHRSSNEELEIREKTIQVCIEHGHSPLECRAEVQP